MALTEAYTFNATVSTTELSLTGGTSTIQTRTTACMAGVWIDTTNWAKGDVFVIRGYEKVRSADTQRVFVEWSVSGAQDENQPPLMFPVMNGWDFTIVRTGGADRTVSASVRTIA